MISPRGNRKIEVMNFYVNVRPICTAEVLTLYISSHLLTTIEVDERVIMYSSHKHSVSSSGIVTSYPTSTPEVLNLQVSFHPIRTTEVL